MKIKTIKPGSIKSYLAIAAIGTLMSGLSGQASAQIIGTPVVGGFQDGSMVQSVGQTVQRSAEDLAKADMGAELYDTGAGVGIRSVFTNSPAQKAGLQSGFIITKANGTATQNVSQLQTMISGMKAGDSVKITATNQGKEREVTVQLMTMGDIIQASIVPEPSAFEEAAAQAQRRIESMKQQIKNAEADLAEMKNQLAAQEKQLAELTAQAQEAKAAAEKAKQAAEEKEAAEKADAEKAAAEKTAAEPATVEPVVEPVVEPAAVPTGDGN